jgi:hypothetical protein
MKTGSKTIGRHTHHFICPDDQQQCQEDPSYRLTHRCDLCHKTRREVAAGVALDMWITSYTVDTLLDGAIPTDPEAVRIEILGLRAVRDALKNANNALIKEVATLRGEQHHEDASPLQEKEVMPEFIVRMHNHAGWQSSTHSAENATEAARQAVMDRVPWLMQYPHELTIDLEKKRYRVDYTGPPRMVALGHVQEAGYWWSEDIRIGKPDDCLACGGSGMDHYTHGLSQCWKCNGRKTV